MASILQKFYEGRVVLLTGGTGFLGKMLLLKLLHSCPDIGAIILLLREKHGQSCQERLLNILSSSVGGKCLSFDPSGVSQFLWLFQEFNPLNPELNPICCLLALLGANHFLHVNRIRVKSLILRLLLSYIYIYIYIYMEHPFLMFLDHTQRRSTVGRTPLDE